MPVIPFPILESAGLPDRPLKGICEGVQVDSRLVKKGDLFFALKGARADGHDFLEEAASKGAVGAVIQRDFQGRVPNGFPVIRSQDPLKALQDMARARVSSSCATIIGVTGSIGKTTTKEFIRQIIGRSHSTAYTTGNQNSKIGMAQSLLNTIQGDEEFLVVEMGMTEKGHILQLIDIVPLDIACITTVALVHAENFQSLEEIAQAKAEIFSHPRTKMALFSYDSPYKKLFEERAHGRVLHFSMGEKKAHFGLQVLENELSFREGGRIWKMERPSFPAPHNYENLLAAVSTCRAAGLSWDEIEEALPHLVLPPKRLENREEKGILFINDSYNASEMSMMAALDVLKGHAPRRRIAVLGQMRELGNFSKGCHERVGERAYAAAEKLYCLGEEAFPMVQKWKEKGASSFWTTSLQELIGQLKKDLHEHDVVLLKGSRSNELWKVLEAFSEG